ncbi:hypothetical protein VQ643_06440 [Pseudomonas sp. F1_0610]|uniref:hypothetical protein n=1 Tax=Pseudomonas sp. F1_0610 TaxID=3114284 RepID=UPI0039C26FB3
MAAEYTNSQHSFHYQLLAAWLKSSRVLSLLSLALLLCGAALSVHYEQLFGLLSHIIIALFAQYFGLRLYMDGLIFQSLTHTSACDKLEQLDASLHFLFGKQITATRTLYERICACRRLYIYFALALLIQLLSIVRQVIYILYF